MSKSYGNAINISMTAEEIGMGGAGALKKYVTDDVRPHCDGVLETTGMDGAFEELVERYLEA